MFTVIVYGVLRGLLVVWKCARFGFGGGGEYTDLDIMIFIFFFIVTFSYLLSINYVYVLSWDIRIFVVGF